MIRTTLIASMATAVLLAGCGGDDKSATTAAMQGDGAMKHDSAMKSDTAMKGGAAMQQSGAVVKVVSSKFGPVVADRKGEALYLFDKEQGARSECYGACATAWPPVLTKSKPRAANGIKAAKLGTTRRRDGKLQITYAGHPLYYYVHDAPGKILCNDVTEFGGTWLVVAPSGSRAT